MNQQRHFQWDVFISHASEDRQSIALPLAEALERCGLRVWIDQQQLSMGDSLRRKIDQGSAYSRWGVVILSPDFFAKEWPNKELDGLVARDQGREKVVLPVWHNVTKSDVAMFSPLLSDKLAASTQAGLDIVVKEILRAVSPRVADPARPAPFLDEASHDDVQQPAAADKTMPPGTEVRGVIPGDTVWTAAGNPYIVTANSQVPSGVTLTIRPGVIVRFNVGRYIQVNGTLRALGSSAQPIRFTTSVRGTHWAGVYFARDAAPWDEVSEGGCVLNHAILEHGGYGAAEGQSMGRHGGTIIAALSAIRITNCLVRWSGRDGITIDADTIVARSHISNNATRGILILGGRALVSHNVIRENTDSGIYAGPDSNPRIWANRIVRNGRDDSSDIYGGGIRVDGSAIVCGNEISRNSANGVTLVGGSSESARVTIQGNNLEDNVRYALFLHGWRITVDATGNWWGAIATDEMNRLGTDADIQVIYDQHDDFSLGSVDYSNWACAPFQDPLHHPEEGNSQARYP